MRKDQEGEKYLQSYPKLKKWINECIICHRTGYDPQMPEKITIIDGSMEVYFIKKYFSPLQLNDDAICEECEHILNARRNKINELKE